MNCQVEIDTRRYMEEEERIEQLMEQAVDMVDSMGLVERYELCGSVEINDAYTKQFDILKGER